MNRQWTTLVILLACVAGFVIPRAASQPTPVAPPEIYCKHFLYGYGRTHEICV